MECIFNSPPHCTFLIDSVCIAPKSLLVRCSINHRRLMFTSTGRYNLLKSFTETVLDNPERKK